MKRRTIVSPLAALLLAAPTAPVLAQASPGIVYRCPGPPVLYTDQLTPQEARDRDCKTIEGAPITVIQGRPKAASGAASRPAGAAEKSVGAEATTSSRPSSRRTASV